MDGEEIIADLNNKLNNLLKKVPVNYVVCRSNKSDVDGWDFEKYEKYLSEDGSHRIIVNSAIFLNSLREKSLSAQYVDDELHTEVRLFTETFNEKVPHLAKLKKYLPDLNDFFSAAFHKIDDLISKLNIICWLKDHDVFNKENVLWLLIGNNRKSYKGNFFDISTYCYLDFDLAFKIRINILMDVKYPLVNLYSRYLIGAFYGNLPKLKMHPSKADICGLINALYDSSVCEEPEDLKLVLMQLFGLNAEEFRKYTHEFSRKSLPSKFHKKFITSFLPKRSYTIEWKDKGQ